MTMVEEAPAEDGWDWAVVEIFGHRRHVGRIREEERFGTKMLRIDVPRVEGAELTVTGYASHYYGGASIFSITPTDEPSAIRANRGYAAPSRTALPDYSDSDGDGDDHGF